MAYDYFQVPGTKTLLHIDTAVERKRAELFTPLLSAHGTKMKHRPYDGGYYIKNSKGRCFDQAMWLAKKMGLTYVEGFMIFTHPGGVMAIGHGWCIGRDGYVCDPTSWEYTGRDDILYAGVPIKTEYSDKWKEWTGYYGCMDGYFDGREVHTNVGIYADDPELWVASKPL